MTKIKLCGLTRSDDIETANELAVDYIGFVFARNSRRYLPFDKARELKSRLAENIKAIGVFVNEDPVIVAKILKQGIIDGVQLHGSEDHDYIKKLKELTNKPIIKAYRIKKKEDLNKAYACIADYLLLDSGSGSGQLLDFDLIKDFKRPYFLAGGLDSDNVAKAISYLKPAGVDVSSGIETAGLKDRNKMIAFVNNVRKEEKND